MVQFLFLPDQRSVGCERPFRCSFRCRIRNLTNVYFVVRKHFVVFIVLTTKKQIYVTYYLW